MRRSSFLFALCALASIPFAFAQTPPRTAPPTPDRVLVPAGPAIIGSNAGEPDERPQHTVTLPAFMIDRTEVTRANWARCVRARACTEPRPVEPRFEEPEQPVVGVSWFQATAYCAWAGGRLPTELEWEKAARGSEGRTFPWGEDRPNNVLAAFGREEGTGHPDRVGMHPRGASPYGALDMAGNVWEWVDSPYDPYAYLHPERPSTCTTALEALNDLRTRGVRGFTGSNPLPDTCERILRGGGWNYGGAGLRSCNRVHHAPNFRLLMSGFRCAADVPSAPAQGAGAPQPQPAQTQRDAGAPDAPRAN